jgi:hypothetical protein
MSRLAGLVDRLLGLDLHDMSGAPLARGLGPLDAT